MTSDSVVEHHFTISTKDGQTGMTETRSYVLRGAELELSLDFDDGSRFEARWVRVEV